MNAASYIHEKTIVFTVTTNGYKFLTWNLWLHVTALCVPWKLCILCLDKESHRFFQQIAGIPSVLLPGISLGSQGNQVRISQHGSNDFNRITRHKLTAFTELIKQPGVEKLLYLDSDIVVFHNPLPVLEDYLTAEKPLWFQCDEHNTTFTCSGPGGHCGNCCTGVIGLYLGTEETRTQFLDLFSFDDALWKTCRENNDQEYIQKRMALRGTQYRTLPRDLFPNGLFLRDDIWKSLKKPVLLHFNFLVGDAKPRVIKSRGFWLVPY